MRGEQGTKGRGEVKLLAICLLGLLGAAVSGSAKDPAQNTDEQKAATVIKEFRSRLGIPQQVSVSIIGANARLVSVRRSQPQAENFVVEFDRNFLTTLNDEELRTVIAHEMGHVWIFTHHPYLQTEALANEKALELVSWDSLEKVYEKVWQHEGQKGTLEEFLARVEMSPQSPSAR